MDTDDEYDDNEPAVKRQNIKFVQFNVKAKFVTQSDDYENEDEKRHFKYNFGDKDITFKLNNVKERQSTAPRKNKQSDKVSI